MDPVIVLHELRELARDFRDGERRGAGAQALAIIGGELVEHFEALDKWMTQGGVSPWNKR
jgi:hypothetical protein